VAEENKPTRILRAKSETIREKVEKTASGAKEAKPRRLQSTTRKVATPFRAIGRFFGKISKYIIPPYFRNSWKELRQVTWPTRRETFRLTGAVIAFSIVFGALIALVDFLLDKLFKEVLLK
jgi:preprotein translocase SecE subunit